MTQPTRSPHWMSIDWRDHQHWIDVDGRQVHYVEMGQGPALLLLHGLSCTWRFWLETIPALAASHRVIAPDLPGFGASDMPAEPISMAGYGSWSVRLLETLGVSTADLAGSSMGGFVAAETAIAFPQTVRSLILVSPAGIAIQSLKDNRYFRLLRAADLELAGSIGAETTRAALRRSRVRKQALALVFAQPDRIAPELVAELSWGFGKPGFGPALAAMVSEPLRDHLERIVAPTLIVWGDHDHVTPLRDAQRFQREIPNARIVVVPQSGHLSMLERPEIVNELMSSFLAGDAGAQPPASAGEGTA